MEKSVLFKSVFVFALAAFAAMPAFAQIKPKIAVYVASEELKDNEKRIVSTKVLAPFVQSGNFTAVERSDVFLSGIERERKKQRDGSVDNNQISRIGKEAGVQYICIADLIDAFGIYNLSARVIDTETAEIVGFGETEMKNIGELGDAANRIFDQIVGKSTQPPPPQPYQQPYPQSSAQDPTWQPEYYEQESQTTYTTSPKAQKTAAGEYRNFTKGQRWGTWALNFVPPWGLGSWIIMKDTFGGIMHMGFGLAATISYITALADSEQEDCSYYGGYSYCDYSYEPDLTWFGIFCVSGMVWNAIRSASYNKPNRYAMLDPNNFQLAVAPSGRNRSLKPGLFYNVRF